VVWITRGSAVEQDARVIELQRGSVKGDRNRAFGNRSEQLFVIVGGYHLEA
jgi:hypothetical protein